MIKCFIDENTGKSEILDTIRFVDNQSVGLYYQKRLFFMSDSKTETISLDGDGTMFIYDTSVTTGNLQDMIKMSFTSTGTYYSTGTYLHYINLGTKSDTIGDYNCTLEIGNNKYTASATFWGDREENRVLLHNFGTDIPTDVSRAVYESNVHSLAPDYLLLNRKYKELLLNYLDILGNKGSLKSLRHSLDWFEYGDMVSLREFWSTPDKVKMYEKELTDTYSDVLKEIISMYTKSTFISINLDLDQVTPGVYELEDKESAAPLVSATVLDWAIEDMMLKMTLLGNYFSTFFMPLHLNLLYSSVVNTAFPSPAKIKVNSGQNTIDNVYKYNDLRLVNRIYDEYVIGDIRVGAKLGTPAVSTDERIGVIPLEEVKNEDADDGTSFYDEFSNNLAVGLGAVVPLEFEGDREFVSCAVSVNGASIKTPVNFKNSIILYIFIKDPGDKTIDVNFIDGDGYISSRSYKVRVSYPASNHFTFKLLKPRDLETISTESDIYQSITFEHDDYENRDTLYYPSYFQRYITVAKAGWDVRLLINGEVVKEFSSVSYENLFAWLNTAAYRNKFVILTRGEEYIYVVSKDNDLVLEIQYKEGVDYKRLLGEFRLIPSIYEANATGDPSDVGLVQLVPDDIYVNRTGSIAWVITNESTRDTNIIKNITTPIVWGTGKQADNYNGTYSVSLAVMYNDVAVVHTRDKVWRIKNNSLK